MSKKNTKQPPGYRQGDPSASKPVDRHRFPKQVTGALAISLLCSGLASAQGDSPVQLCQFIGEQVGEFKN